MITLDDLCAQLLPPDDHIKFQSLIIDSPRLIRVAAMILSGQNIVRQESLARWERRFI